MLYLWWKLLKIPAYTREMLLILGITMIVNAVVLVRTATTNYIILYIPLLLCLQLVTEWFRRGKLYVVLFYIFSLVAMWILFLSTIQGDFEHPIMYLPLPITLLILFIWGLQHDTPSKA